MGPAVRTFLATAACAWLLGGCADDAAKKRALAEAQARCSQLYAEADIGSIKDKIVVSGDAARTSFALMAETAKPDAAERAAVGRYAKAIGECRAVHDAAVGEPGAIEQRARTAADALRARLYNGDITFGEYNRGIAQINADRDAEVEKERKEAERARQLRQALTYPSYPAGPYYYCWHYAWPYC